MIKTVYLIFEFEKESISIPKKLKLAGREAPFFIQST